jgi:putative nucleotidyltransferase with HDIG domain
MEETLKKLIPELDLISDAGLKHKVLAVWKEALELGGWQPDDLKTIPFTLLIPDCPIGFLDHVRAVTRTAVEAAGVMEEIYGDAIAINRDHLVAGALLHDIGKLLEYRRQGESTIKSRRGELLRHPFTGAALTFKHDLPDEVTHMVALHAKEGEGAIRSVEAIIITHADFLNYESLKRHLGG